MLSLLSKAKTEKVILCSKRSCIRLSWGMVSPVNCIGKLSTSLVNFAFGPCKELLSMTGIAIISEKKIS